MHLPAPLYFQVSIKMLHYLKGKVEDSSLNES
ncbi:uncharacterized protein EAE97_000753 [Botrytis byssoidea]|uniref:Uncharacterized protein n=1 Tax=Botrytis byssoidea TaxID=139641 RepID=A0A9P5IYN4_9HELO|nr:uncharacterized protein EAE97_000753 [Botrytis byssoidea]KAF7955494.1 hypothetical protein EAE97_000753 [Botrytis byssoidea]